MAICLLPQWSIGSLRRCDQYRLQNAALALLWGYGNNGNHCKSFTQGANWMINLRQAAVKIPTTARKAIAKAPVEWDLRLYVAGATPKSSLALRNLKRLCKEHLAGQYRIEIVDLTKNPQLGLAEQILALPALVRKGPFAGRKLIGNLSDTERVLASLDVERKS
jgi:circadian clock protein KaiB